MAGCCFDCLLRYGLWTSSDREISNNITSSSPYEDLLEVRFPRPW